MLTSRELTTTLAALRHWQQQLSREGLAFAGQFKDALGAGVVSEIANYPNFEHLEARGRRDA